MMTDAEKRGMDRAYDLWAKEEDALKALHAAVDEYAELVFTEWHEVRGCTKEAALGVVKDRLTAIGGDGMIDHLNKLYREKL